MAISKKSAKESAKKVAKKAAKKTAKKAAKKTTTIKTDKAVTSNSKVVTLLGQTIADSEVEVYLGSNSAQSLVKLPSLVGKNGMILYFYPKDSTPGCTTEACDFRDSNEVIRSLGYSVIGVSPDSISSHQRFSEKQKLQFPLISDTNKTLCQEFQVWQQKQLYGRQFMGVVRSTFLIDNKLKVWHVISPVKVKGHIEEILNLINK